MPGKGSAVKRHKQSEKRRIRNKMAKSEIRTEIKKFLQAVDNKNSEVAEANFRKVTSLLDSAAKKGLYHKNTAARTKSRLNKKMAAITAS